MKKSKTMAVNQTEAKTKAQTEKKGKDPPRMTKVKLLQLPNEADGRGCLCPPEICSGPPAAQGAQSAEARNT